MFNNSNFTIMFHSENMSSFMRDYESAVEAVFFAQCVRRLFITHAADWSESEQLPVNNFRFRHKVNEAYPAGPKCFLVK